MSQKMWEELYNDLKREHSRLIKKTDRAAQEYESQKQVWIEKRAELQEDVDRYRNLAGGLDVEFGDLKREKIALEKELEKLRGMEKDPIEIKAKTLFNIINGGPELVVLPWENQPESIKTRYRTIISEGRVEVND